MGMIMSYMGGTGEGLASQTLSLVSGALYDQFMKKDVKSFDAFHTAILDIFNTINMALPGKHYDVPSNKEIENFFKKWNDPKEENKKDIFTDFMIKYVNISKVDDSMMITGIVAPPAAMVAKRSGQSVPQLSALKVIPDVIFVPTATILALIAVKVTKRMSIKKLNPI
ncbi:calcium ion-binding protein [Trifolium repens]|nr:calcium ion-binding protein [Trifolium repens]